MKPVVDVTTSIETPISPTNQETLTTFSKLKNRFKNIEQHLHETQRELFFNNKPVTQTNAWKIRNQLYENKIFSDHDLDMMDGVSAGQWEIIYREAFENPNTPIENIYEQHKENNRKMNLNGIIPTEDQTEFTQLHDTIFVSIQTELGTMRFALEDNINDEILNKYESIALTLPEESMKIRNDGGKDIVFEPKITFHETKDPNKRIHRRVSDENSSESSTTANYKDLISNLEPTDPRKEEITYSMLTCGMFTTEDVGRIVQVLEGHSEAVCLTYFEGFTWVFKNLIRLYDLEYYTIPQERKIILTNNKHEKLEKFEQEFPEKQFLSQEDRKEIHTLFTTTEELAKQICESDYPNLQYYRQYYNLIRNGMINTKELKISRLPNKREEPTQKGIFNNLSEGRKILKKLEQYDKANNTNYAEEIEKDYLTNDRYYFSTAHF